MQEGCGMVRAKESKPQPASADMHRAMYRDMLLARELSDRMFALNRQGRAAFAVTGQGHEAAQVGSASALGPEDFVFPTFRELAAALVRGVDAVRYLWYHRGTWHGGPYDPRATGFGPICIPIANQIAHGVGYALGQKLDQKKEGSDACVLVYFGDGGSSQGEAHEAMNFASVHSLAIVFICENNRYAISVPQGRKMAISDVASRAAGYGFPGVVVDGMDLLQCYEATREAIHHARKQGPVLLEMKVERLMPHTTDDDDRRYRPR
jgi:pyruvate dehydrogenase E1 component alpha subunit